MKSDLTVGEVLKPQGIRGELKIKPFTDSETTFKDFTRVFIDGAEYKILSCRTGGGAVYLGLRGIPDRNAAELFRGKQLTVPRSDAPALPEGRYYVADLEGCEVRTETGELCGMLKTVLKSATDIYVVEKDGKEILFPAAAGVVRTVDLEARLVTVDAKRYRETAVL